MSRRRFLGGTAAMAAAAVGAVGSVMPSAGAAGAQPHGRALAGAAAPSQMSASLLTDWIREIYGHVRTARCSPPSAARIYAHVSLAAWEAVAAGVPAGRSLRGQLKGLAGSTPSGARAVRFDLVLNRAIADAAAAVFADRTPELVRSIADRGAELERALVVGVPRPLAQRSVVVGAEIGASIATRAGSDGYAGLAGRSFQPPTGVDKWIPTPPNFGGSIEPFWSEVTAFTLVTNDAFKPPAPVEFSTDPTSAFYAQAAATRDAVVGLSDTQRDIALYWRDNPDGSTGLPAGHWMLIACDVIDSQDLDLARAAEVLVLLGLSLADGFTSCWTEKYQTNLLRPVTYIQRYIDPTWKSFVNSPAFPEYTSGHSVGSAAAAGALTATLGPIPFTDSSSPLSKGLQPRHYPSFWAAAEEAAGSRLAGGIHYPMGIDAGLVQGADVARNVLATARLR